jgi:ankyrin repeat protein
MLVDDAATHKLQAQTRATLEEVKEPTTSFGSIQPSAAVTAPADTPMTETSQI